VTTFESVAVLLGIGLVGFWIIRRKLVPDTIFSLLSPLALEIALPCLIFVRIIQDFSIQELPEWWQLPLWWLFFTGIAAGLTGLFMFVSKKSSRREFSLTLFYQNGIFFPLAILSGMFPNEPSYVISLILFTLFYPAFFFSTYFLFYRSSQKKVIHWKKIFHPVLLVTLLALAIRLTGLHTAVPTIVLDMSSLLGGMTIPLIMLILGGNMYVDFHKKGDIQLLEISKFVLAKNIVFPLIFIGILLLFKPIFSYTIALLILLQSAVPPVTASPLVIERMGGNRILANQFLFASFLLSLISIPVIVTIFTFFF